MVDRRRKNEEDFFEEITAVLSLVWQMPLGSVTDLLKPHNTVVTSRATLISRLDWLERRDYIGSETVGWVRRRCRRFYLHAKGVYWLMNRLGVPLEWAVTEKGLWTLRFQMPALETLYHLLPDLWRSGAVASASQGDWQLVKLSLLGTGKILALAEYGRPYPAPEDGDRRIVAFVWYGVRSLRGSVAKDLSDAIPNIGVPKLAISGVVILAADRFAGMCARLDIHPELPRAIVTVDGEVVEQLDEIIPSGPIPPICHRGLRLGSPENLTSRIADDPALSALVRRTDYTILRAHEDWAGSDEKTVIAMCGHGRSEVRKTTKRLEDAKLVEPAGKSFYPANGLRNLLEKRDRLDRRRVRGRAGAERDQGNTRRKHMKTHDAGVGRLALRFRQEGLFPAVGWRQVIKVQGRTQITPDLWALIPYGNNLAAWHAVEYERSAAKWDAVERKMRPYIVANQLGETYLLLVVCDTPEAARNFGEVGARYGVPLLVGTKNAVLSSPSRGIGSPWQFMGQTVDIDHLTGLKLWSPEKATLMRSVLRERTDLTFGIGCGAC